MYRTRIIAAIELIVIHNGQLLITPNRMTNPGPITGKVENEIFPKAPKDLKIVGSFLKGALQATPNHLSKSWRLIFVRTGSSVSFVTPRKL